MQVSPQPPRFNVQQAVNGIRATIPARRSWVVVLFLFAWLVAWYFAEMNAIHQVQSPSDKEEELFLLAWLVAWTIGGVFAAAIFLWQLAGREVVTIGATTLEHRIEAFGLGRSRSYRIADIRQLRAEKAPSSLFGNQAAWLPPVTGSGVGQIAFDYGARTFHFAPSLEEAEAKLLVERLSTHLTQR